ncbi:ParB N-terminal domain-containing protein [Streptomyces diastaticus]|uniref:ParB N-terminal domain-containing protein n=1 Tax=Streptomyces diastaticus TaxID=1956 RepID=UPI0036AEC6EA
MTNTKTQAGVQAAPAPWPTLTVAELSAHSGNIREVQAPADLLADVKNNGVEEPLYVVRTHGEVPQIIDGFQRFAAAVAAGLETVPVTPRPVIRLDALTPHPKNAREDLDINAAFVESFRAEACRIPVKIQRLAGGVLQVNDGNRRYYGAKDAGLTHVPYEWEDDDRDEAGQFLDMITTAQHRKSLTTSEMNQAMFSAAEAGAQVGRIAKAAGVRQKDVKTLVKVRSHEKLSAAVSSASTYEWTFERLAALAEFEDDPEVLAAISEAATRRGATAGDVDWVIAVARTRRDKQAKAEAHRAELEGAGAKIRTADELSERALPVWRLSGVTAREHEECKGQVWVLDDRRGDRYEPYCSAPSLYGHASLNGAGGAGGTKTPAEREAERAARAAVKAGNLEWDAAESLRRKWITDLIKRRNLPKDATNALVGHVNNALLDGTWGVSDDLNKQGTTEILGSFLGLSVQQAKDRSSFTKHVAKDPRRSAQFQFAAIAAVREMSATRGAWRTDHQRNPWRRERTAGWFRVLTSLGYPLTPIEQAVVDDEPYAPTSKKSRAAITSGGAPQGGQEASADEEEGEPEAEEADEPASDDEAAT